MTHLFKRDLSYLIKAISTSTPGAAETEKPVVEEEEVGVREDDDV